MDELDLFSEALMKSVKTVGSLSWVMGGTLCTILPRLNFIPSSLTEVQKKTFLENMSLGKETEIVGKCLVEHCSKFMQWRFLLPLWQIALCGSQLVS